MMLAAVETTENWPEAAIAIAGIALVGSVIIVAVWQLLATWRTRMLGSRETDYRKLAEQALEAQTRTAAALEQVLAELRRLREVGVEQRQTPEE
jgi:Tfp pilus assembly protein PilO